MTNRRRILNSIGGLLLLGALGYFVYGYATAERRLKGLCGNIKAGTSSEALREFALAHELRPPRGDGINYLVETKTFGRYGCQVTVENQVVKESRYGFAD
jgi:hypothetical protein